MLSVLQMISKRIIRYAALALSMGVGLIVSLTLTPALTHLLMQDPPRPETSWAPLKRATDAARRATEHGQLFRDDGQPGEYTGRCSPSTEMSTDLQVVWEVMKWPLAASLLFPPLLVYLGLHVVKREVIGDSWHLCGAADGVSFR